MAGLTHTNGFGKIATNVDAGKSMSIEYYGKGGLLVLRTGFNSSVGLYVLNYGGGYSVVKETPGENSLFKIVVENGTVTITNTHTGHVGMSAMVINLD